MYWYTPRGNKNSLTASESSITLVFKKCSRKIDVSLKMTICPFGLGKSAYRLELPKITSIRTIDLYTNDIDQQGDPKPVQALATVVMPKYGQ